MIPPEHFDAGLGAMVRDPKNARLTVAELLDLHEQRISEAFNDDEEYQDTTDRIIATLTVIGIIVGVAIWAILSRS